jgi:hypothetical protein
MTADSYEVGMRLSAAREAGGRLEYRNESSGGLGSGRIAGAASAQQQQERRPVIKVNDGSLMATVSCYGQRWVTVKKGEIKAREAIQRGQYETEAGASMSSAVV